MIYVYYKNIEAIQQILRKKERISPTHPEETLLESTTHHSRHCPGLGGGWRWMDE
jgi:hypothetical protein